MTKQIGCKAEDARFIACNVCLFQNDSNRCEKVRKEGNLNMVIKCK